MAAGMPPPMLLLLFFLLLTHPADANPGAKRLYDDLLSNYNKLIRPVGNNSDRLLVKLGLKLSQLIDVNGKNQIKVTNVWLEVTWYDYKGHWNPASYGGVDDLYVPLLLHWGPDIVLYNNADGKYEVVTYGTAGILHKVEWKPPAIYKSFCEIDVEYFPFDEQKCVMKFGSWTYNGAQVDLLKHRIDQNYDDNKVSPEFYDKEYIVGIKMREHYTWLVPSERHEKYYTCCAEWYPIFFNIGMRRKTLFYTVNLIIPCVGISFLTILVFYLPKDSNEKVGLSISILLSLGVFFLLITGIIPPTSLVVPLIDKFVLFTKILVTLSVVVTVAVLNDKYRKPVTHRMSPWVKLLFIGGLPLILLMRGPEQDDKDLASKRGHHHNHGATKLSAAAAAAMAAAASSTAKSNPDSVRLHHLHQHLHLHLQLKHLKHDKGCNGMKAASHNRFGASAGAFGGLPSHHLGDGSLSDVYVVRKPYPFEMEKAIHDKGFIQNHVAEQDEFGGLDEFDQDDQDWGFVAMVLDRLFLWIFTIAGIVGTFKILSEAPGLYDKTKLIDMATKGIDMAASGVALLQFLPDIGN
uniref:Nicotinic acetylcholine receptor alpha 3 subunit n=2 Tax=Nilaparvata lugens TaxID=108931 RepID=Q6U4B7_NILLU|nr:nicotinic acetylcholine receptor alpha 3 subunit [Nilaparvata lugens]AAQ75740.1 nicotinic acetylcholine receptor alpha 3 subunit [Nilaparvata lugens]